LNSLLAESGSVLDTSSHQLHPGHTHSKNHLAAIMLGSAALLCIAIVGAVFVLTRRGPDLESQRTGCATTLNQFMTLMAQNHLEPAQLLWASGSIQRFDVSELRHMVDGANRCQFDNFESIVVLQASPASPPGSYAPHGKYLDVTCRVRYKSGLSTRMQARLHKDDDGWKLWSVHIDITSAMLKRYIENVAI
jgi:hypothetical protein